MKRDENAVRLYLADATELGEEALGEIAADAVLSGGDSGSMFRAVDFTQIAQTNGFDANPSDAIELNNTTDIPAPMQVEAWSLGERCAKEIRGQEKLDGQPIDDKTLTAFAGIAGDAISLETREPRDNAYIFRTGQGKRSFPSSAPVTAEYGSTF